MSLVFAVAASYLLGSIPFAILAGRWRGVDLLTHGSGNPGATNAIRVLGPGIGIPVLLADIAKGAVAVAVFGAAAGGDPRAGLVCGGAAVVGHVWPVWLRFRGGKGVATAAGAFVALAPAATGIAALVFAIALVSFRYMSVASMAGAIALPVMLAWRGAGRPMLAASIVIAALVILRHRSNVARLLAGTEHRVRFGSRKGVAS